MCRSVSSPSSPGSPPAKSADVASDGQKRAGARRMLQVAIATLPDRVLHCHTQTRALEPRHASATFKEKFRFRFKTLGASTSASTDTLCVSSHALHCENFRSLAVFATISGSAHFTFDSAWNECS